MAAFAREALMSAPEKPFMCRTNLHHSWEWAKTPDGKVYERCSHCHKERDESGTSSGLKTGGYSLGGGGG